MAILTSLSWLKGQTIELFFPGVCVGCGKTGDFFCLACRLKLPYLNGPVCPKCGRPAAGATVCGDCHSLPPATGSIRYPFAFDGVMRSAIHQFKYKDIRALARPLAGLLWAYARDNGVTADSLVPVPLHKNKLKERGYNQAELLAVEFGKLAGWPVQTDVLVRVKDTGPQARSASAGVRRGNVTGAFSATGVAPKGKAVLLIDDVCTTGATLDACATVLRKFPGVSVSALALAREL